MHFSGGRIGVGTVSDLWSRIFWLKFVINFFTIVERIPAVEIRKYSNREKLYGEEKKVQRRRANCKEGKE